MTPQQPGDAASMIGLETRSAVVFAALFLTASCLIGLASGEATSTAAVIGAYLLMASVFAALLRTAVSTIGSQAVLALLPAAALAVGTAAITRDAGIAYYPLAGSATVAAAFTCVRGRLKTGWTSTIACAATALAMAHFDLSSTEVAVRGIQNGVAVVAAATIFSVIARPAVAETYALQQQATRDTETTAAEAARRHERDIRLARLDRKVRPLLERIATGSLSDADAREASLIEAHLRDAIRARSLVNATLDDAIARLRENGGTVTLLDDSDLDASSGPRTIALQRVSEHLVSALTDITDAVDVTIRVLPAGRPVLASLTISRPDEVLRTVYDHDGRRVLRPAP